MTGTSYKIGFLMDAYETLNLATETSLLCMDELMRRGHEVFWLEQQGLSLENGRVAGRLAAIESTSPFDLNSARSVDVNALDALLIRKDPPFDRSYLHLTYLLDFLDPSVVQINSPSALRNVNEKLYILNWPDYCPDTLVSLDIEQLAEFARRHHKIVLKPLDDCSGRGIQFARYDEPHFRSKIQPMLARHGYVMAQAFLRGIANGDKRVYLVDGAPVGWVNRIPAPGNDLANIHQGAVCRAGELSAIERNISETVGRKLRDHDILLGGLDFIDGRLTEVNVTSPSAIRQINEVHGIHLERVIIDAIVHRVEESHQSPHDGLVHQSLVVVAEGVPEAGQALRKNDGGQIRPGRNP